jgi:hypothetical protein
MLQTPIEPSTIAGGLYSPSLKAKSEATFQIGAASIEDYRQGNTADTPHGGRFYSLYSHSIVPGGFEVTS